MPVLSVAVSPVPSTVLGTQAGLVTPNHVWHGMGPQGSYHRGLSLPGGTPKDPRGKTIRGNLEHLSLF